ncbi:20448_t:CDS:1 [Funneliformis geosporum]|uniref:17064_t:CDS:1 n=1 Tax=Funneliformis geosporum TaxID=1117311 RepID=A0A9W4SIK5_9GLOM|nr:20448_t:CDS:1 [Funneliformis geosporum]CAI2170865.1 17064_t:CDS:1 [Funneliformis geosporum]
MTTIKERNGRLFITIPELNVSNLPLLPIDSDIYKSFGPLNNFAVFRRICQERLNSNCQEVSKIASHLWKQVPKHVKDTLKEYSSKIAKAKAPKITFKTKSYNKEDYMRTKSTTRRPKKIKDKPIELNSVEAMIPFLIKKPPVDELWFQLEKIAGDIFSQKLNEHQI